MVIEFAGVRCDYLWMAGVLSCVSWGLLKAREKDDPSHGLLVALIASFAFPVWSQVDVLGQELNVRVSVGIFSLLYFGSQILVRKAVRLLISDAFVVGLFLIQMVSDLGQGSPALGTAALAWGEWCLPYLLGRLALLDWRAIRSGLVPSTIVLLLWGVAATWEAFTGANVYILLFGVEPDGGLPPAAPRWGITRAFGPSMHPIYFGVMALLMFPWSVYGVRGVFRRGYSQFLLLSPVAIAAVIIFTSSRAVIFALIVAVLVSLFVIQRKLRTPLIVASVVIVCVGMLFAKPLFEKLRKIGGEKDLRNPDTIVIDGEEKVYTGTFNRIYIFQLYSRAVASTGAFGYGSEATSTFPLNIPVAPGNVEAMKLVRAVDNAFLLILLRLGYFGLIAFSGLGLTAVFYSCSVVSMDKLKGRVFDICLSSALIGVMLTMLTVWMAFDFGFLYLWTIGMSASRRAALLKSSQAHSD